MSPVVTTARLRLEPLALDHLESLYQIYQEPAVGRFLITRPADRAEFERVFQHTLSFGGSHGMWAIYTQPLNELIGRVGFFAFGAERRPELAFLLSARFWGRGLATEAARAALEFGFSTHGWPECVALVRPENRAAQRVCRKLGMQYETDVELGGMAALLYQLTREAFTLQ
jgi:[ribosomal protein S5]-alanine N-acetyltransferase